MVDFADSRKVEMLFEGKGYPVLVAEKALWFGKNNVKKAEEWIAVGNLVEWLEC